MNKLNILRHTMAFFMVMIIVLGFTANSFAAGFDTTLSSVLNDATWNNYVKDAMAADDAPGLVVVAVSGNDIAYSCFGYSNLADKTDMTAETVLQIGSCSKAFTALSIFLLQEQGKLSIDDSVSNYIPWWHVTYQGQDADVKIWQLLNHCAGFPNGPTMAKYETGTDPALTEKTALIAKDYELAAAPGQKFEYCNLDYVLLAYLTQVVSGMQFDDFVEKNILAPLGMNNSGFDLPTAQGYLSFLGRSTPYNAPRIKGAEGEGYLITTASDMSQWIRAQLGQLEIPDDLKNAIAKSHEVNTNYQAAETNGEAYYNGWFSLGNGVISHSGMNPNFTANIIIDPNNGVGVMAISNCVTDAVQYATESSYKLILKNKLILKSDAEIYTKQSRNMMVELDRICSIISVIFAILVIICLVAGITQKKRLSLNVQDIETAKKRFRIKMVLLIPLLIASIILPYIAGFIVGYDTFGYKMFLLWGVWSLVLMCGLMALTFLLLILLSLTRYHRIKTA